MREKHRVVLVARIRQASKHTMAAPGDPRPLFQNYWPE
jgi:hypothetical protein